MNNEIIYLVMIHGEPDGRVTVFNWSACIINHYHPVIETNTVVNIVIYRMNNIESYGVIYVTVNVNKSLFHRR